MNLKPLILKELGFFYCIFNFIMEIRPVYPLICAELAGDFHLGYARQLTDKSSLLFDLAF